MKHPALTRALAAALAVFCLITLLAGVGSLWKTHSDRQEDLRRRQIFQERIEKAAALEQSLSDKNSAYLSASEGLEARWEEHHEAVSDYRERLATYTATRAGILIGRQALDTAFDALITARRKFREGYAEFEKGAAAFNEIYNGYRDAAAAVKRTRELYERGEALLAEGREEELLALLPPEQVLSLVSGTRAGVSALRELIESSDGDVLSGDAAETLKRMQKQMTAISDELGDVDASSLANRAVEQTLAQADALIAERVAQGATEAEAMAEADALTQASLGMSYSEARAYLAGNARRSENTLKALQQLSSMDPEQVQTLLKNFDGTEKLLQQGLTVLREEEKTLTKQEKAMRADPGAMNSGKELLKLLKSVLDSSERILKLVSSAVEEGKKQLDTVGSQLEQAKAGIAKGFDTIAYQRIQMDKQSDDLDKQFEDMVKEKRSLVRTQTRLEKQQATVDEYDRLRQDFRSARAALMSYAGVKEAVDAGGSLIDSAEEELTRMTARQDAENDRRCWIALLMIAASLIGFVAVAGGFEKPRMENLWFVLALSALAAALGEAGSVELGRGLWYSALAMGLTELGILPLVTGKANGR